MSDIVSQQQREIISETESNIHTETFNEGQS